MAVLADRAGAYIPHPRAARFGALVAVANPFAREALVRALRGVGAREVLEAASAAEARVRARAGMSRELLVVGASLPDGPGLGLLVELRNLGWTHSVMLTGSDDPYAVRAALIAGARGFVVASTDPAPAHGARRDGVPQARRGSAAGLSAREVEVLRLVADGRSNKDVGESLGLSALTVKSHLARIARKVGTGDRAEMVIVALRAGVIE